MEVRSHQPQKVLRMRLGEKGVWDLSRLGGTWGKLVSWKVSPWLSPDWKSKPFWDSMICFLYLICSDPRQKTPGGTAPFVENWPELQIELKHLSVKLNLEGEQCRGC